ncbi:HalOD1 output domain-containing protein [Saliphagus infecundisoli]|uniref:HalOD1 output domain-containing protein n=1 Tax=Saliphagus infecundisoli TaxID=1849069 RepID=A0ABD5QBG3_9EURY|nr:HalOD1 output domain-containing protein [Saliphagus infecundisoli]
MAIHDSTEVVLNYNYQCTEGPSEAVIRGIAVVWNVPPSKLVPLYNAIDPEALNALFNHKNDDGKSNITAEFSYMDIHVVVSNTQITLNFQYDINQEIVTAASSTKD